MAARFMPRIGAAAFGRDATSYDDLRALASRYAAHTLAGLTLVNDATQLAITLAPDALQAAIRPGVPLDLLLALSELPALLAHAKYVRTMADPRHRPEIRRLHLLAATAQIRSRTIELLLTVRENFGGQCFFDGMREQSKTPRRDAGGAANAPSDPAVSLASAPLAGEETTSENQVSANSSTPQLSDRDKNYLDRYYDPVNRMAKAYFVDPKLVLGLGAESGFGTSNIFNEHKDALGLSGGSAETQPDFPTYEANVTRFFHEYGPQIWGTGSNAAAFVNALDGKNAAGTAVPGWKTYNTASHDNWLKMMQSGIDQMRRSVPLYLQQRTEQ
ncbi:MAG TPA: hypothetical protein VE397_14950 [Stellaceae bacterium]|jgi:hypothetical protein|nr:hypothetical protein [Stellaceae bacterium]